MARFHRLCSCFAMFLVCAFWSPLVHAQTWFSNVNVSTATTTATINWTTAVPSDSQVQYGPTTVYGSLSTLVATRTTAHSVALTGLTPGTTYHYMVMSRDSDGILVAGKDSTFATALPVTVSVAPSNTVLTSGASQQFTATVSNTTNTGVTWTASAGTISTSGLFTAPTVSTTTTITVTATSVADTSKSAGATITVNPAVAISVSPTVVTVVSGAQQQFTATVSNTSNTAVNWSATAGTVSTSGLFIAPVVITTTAVTVTVTSVADPTKSASAVITVVPAVAVAISPATASLLSGGQQQFTATVSNTSNTAVTWSASAGVITAAGLFTAPTVSSATNVTVTATSQADSAKKAVAAVTVNPTTTPTNYTVLGTRVPATPDPGSDNQVNLGMQFYSDVAGQITAIRFYKSAANTGVHTGTLWTSTGAQLATVTFANETASGWQTQALPTPVAITAGTTYVVSYHCINGHYSADNYFFTSVFDNAPLHVPANGGVYAYGTTSVYPTGSWRSRNYYVDVVLSSSTSTAPPPPPASPTISLSPTSWTFSATQGGSNPSPYGASLTNSGGGTLTYTATSDAAWLSVSPSSGNAPATLQIAPNISGLSAGTYTGHVTVSSSSASNSPVTMLCTLTVNAVAPPKSHTVTLGWTASSSTSVVSYSVYRGTAHGGPYALMSSALGSVSYIDSTVQSGATYYYVATAVDDAGHESSYSNEVKAVIP